MTLHADAAGVLRNWAAPDESQDALRRLYGAHLDRHADGVWRSCAEGHITASALVIDPVGERVLLTLHRKLRMWLQTGGHCETTDTTLAGAALREATEESGVPGLTLLPGGPIRLDRHRTPCAWHLDVQYAAVAPPSAVSKISEESLDLRWFGYPEVASVADESVARLMTRTRTRL